MLHDDDRAVTRNPDDVFNQAPALVDYNLFRADRPLCEALQREGGGWYESEAIAQGERLGQAEAIEQGELANRYPPRLCTHDRFGHRRDQVEFHPAWHTQLRARVSAEVHALPWIRKQQSGTHVARTVVHMLHHQLDEGPSCPTTMTFAAYPLVDAHATQSALLARLRDLISSTTYDPRLVPLGDKRGALVGMAMTERQGGSDVRSNTTRAQAMGASGPGRPYRIEGHKWFCSAPMCDAFFILAQAPKGLSCFLLPRVLEDGTQNAFHLTRLKDKVGNRSNASSEISLEGAWAELVGEEGRGVATIIEMVRHTRLDCVSGSAATLRRALAEVLHHAKHRSAFGKCLIDQPLMKNVLADLCLESEAATALALRLARGFDEAVTDSGAACFTRVVTAAAKFWVTKRAISAVAEAMECLGGNGYVEESPLARLYRDVPLNSLWEGAGNVQCLDVLRSLAKDPSAMEALLSELCTTRGSYAAYDDLFDDLEDTLRNERATRSRPAESLRR